VVVIEADFDTDSVDEEENVLVVVIDPVREPDSVLEIETDDVTDPLDDVVLEGVSDREGESIKDNDADPVLE
jgi:hypothetical protein